MSKSSHKKFSAYMYIFRGNDYNLPYIEALESVLWCDEVRVATDIRFQDETIDRLREFALENKNVVLYEKEFDFDAINPHGKIKQELRNSCLGDWLIELDADEYFAQSQVEKVKDLCLHTIPSINVIAVKQLNFFNGNWINLEHPIYRPLITRNLKQIRHDLDIINIHGRWGAAYITDKGAKLSASYQYDEDVIYHYGWYSLPRKWEMRQTLHYFDGKIQEKYTDLESYTHNLDNEEVDFWDLPWTLPIEHYIGAIYSEMHNAKLKRFKGIHPPEMLKWREDQRVLDWKPKIGKNLSDWVSSYIPRKEATV